MGKSLFPTDGLQLKPSGITASMTDKRLPSEHTSLSLTSLPVSISTNHTTLVQALQTHGKGGITVH